jgi:hypothetical protein
MGNANNGKGNSRGNNKGNNGLSRSFLETL